MNSMFGNYYTMREVFGILHNSTAKSIAYSRFSITPVIYGSLLQQPFRLY